MKKESQFGKNNFDRLAAAGCVAGVDDTENLKAKTEARKHELNVLTAKIQKMEVFLAELYVLPRDRQLKRLAEASTALKGLLASKLPIGAKKHLETCLNEVTSLREGVYATQSKLDKQELALTASAKARTELQAMVVAAEHRLEKVQADSSSDSDMQDFLDKAKEVIDRNNKESTKLEGIKNKPYMLVRAPVVAADEDKRRPNASKLSELGFKAESISGYPVIHNQIVLGINPKLLHGSNGDDAQRFADLARQLKESGVTTEQLQHVAKRIRNAEGKIRDVEKDIGQLNEDADKAYREKKEAELKKNQEDLEKIKGEAQALVKKSGIDMEEYHNLEQSLKRNHQVMPKQVREEAERIVKAMSKKMKVKLQPVGTWEHPHRSPHGGVWFWLMPERELSMLARAIPGGSVKIQRWGFAF